MIKYHHACPEWDYMEISEENDEIFCCNCFLDDEFIRLREIKREPIRETQEKQHNIKVKNILAFLCIFFNEHPALVEVIMNFSPDYLMEKYERYIESKVDESQWGMHPLIKKRIMEPYFEKWGIK